MESPSTPNVAQKCHAACRKPVAESDAGTNNASRQTLETPNTENTIHDPTVTTSMIQPNNFRCRTSARPMLQTPGMYCVGSAIEKSTCYVTWNICGAEVNGEPPVGVQIAVIGYVVPTASDVSVMPALVAVAALLSVIDPGVIAVMVVDAGIPLPVIVSPLFKPVSERMPTTCVFPLVVTPEKVIPPAVSVTVLLLLVAAWLSVNSAGVYVEIFVLAGIPVPVIVCCDGTRSTKLETFVMTALPLVTSPVNVSRLAGILGVATMELPFVSVLPLTATVSITWLPVPSLWEML